jgi:Cu/Ag efflux pump CusA
MTYYGRKINIVLIKSSYCFARFRLFGWGIYSVQENPIDAIPDLSNQVMFFTGVD